MKLLAFGLAALLVMWLCPKAQAQTVGLHVGSVHLDGQLQRVRGWNDVNPGVYVRWDSGLVAGAFVNSLKRRSHYVGWSWQARPVARFDRLEVALALGVMDGYDRLVADDFAGEPGPGQHVGVRCSAEGRCRRVLLRPVVQPMVVPSAALWLDERTAARVSLLANVSKDGAHAVHLSLERRW